MGLVRRKTTPTTGVVCNNRKIFLSVNFILSDARPLPCFYRICPIYLLKQLKIRYLYIMEDLFKDEANQPL
jgi:hypothetical protein